MPDLSSSRLGRLGLILALLLCSPVSDAAPRDHDGIDRPSRAHQRPARDHTGPARDRSDLNRDSIVDEDDLALLSARDLRRHDGEINWCGFYKAIDRGERFASRKASFYQKRYPLLLEFIGNTYRCETDRSDLIRDGKVDEQDLRLFSSRILEVGFDTVDWCAFREATRRGDRFAGKMTAYYSKNFQLLIEFIHAEYECEDGPALLVVANRPRSLARVALDAMATGNYYMTDARVGSVFIFDPDLNLIGELKGLDKPLGVAIDTQGNLLVGNSGRDNIEIYEPATGNLLGTFGEDQVRMPSAITIGPGGEILVTDSRSHTLWVFDADYLFLRAIGAPQSGPGQLSFPTDAEVVSRYVDDVLVDEVFVADQRHHLIQVFDLDGNFLRSLESQTPPAPAFCGCPFSFCQPCPPAVGTFTRLKALDSDAEGRLHVLDGFEATVSILDPADGSHIDYYGAWGNGPDLLRTPFDVLVTHWGEAIVTDSASDEIEVFAIP